MINFFGKIFAVIFGRNSRLATIVIAMFPIIELKGAIPVGVSCEFWGDSALTEPQAFVFSLIGSCLVVPIIALVFRPIINYMKQSKIFKKFALVIEEKVRVSSSRIGANSLDGGSFKRTILKMLGVFGFVSIPLPLTGVWTGTCIAVFLGLKFWQVVLSVVLGNIVAGVLITFVCAMFPNFTSILFLIVLAFVIVILLSMVVKLLVTKKSRE